MCWGDDSTPDTTMKCKPNRQTAPQALMAKKAEIDAMLARLQTICDEHFGCAPDEINWGHVGTIADYASLLQRIADSAFGEGEHALSCA